ncbi:MAG: isoprenylcysteine carboxylmethyltransferase family protein, partial [Alphaproteobacteria bacterium]|nr:isoprenylcysteine carboxylmethyltransferase family protein [Alphaproteobacteria bacterium]
FSFFKPKTKVDWRVFNGFAAFIIALFVEMYGFPLTLYFLSGWLGSRFPQINLFSHDAGHLWYSFLGFQGNPHFNPIHLFSNFLILIGFIFLSSSWRILYAAQCEHRLAETGPYAYVRHPQYVAFILIMFGFLIEWPTLVTLFMFPILVTMYTRLARKEEEDAKKDFGGVWEKYAGRVPAFFPKLFSKNKVAL